MSELSAFSRDLLAAGKGAAVPPAAKGRTLTKISAAAKAPAAAGVSFGVVLGGAALLAAIGAVTFLVAQPSHAPRSSAPAVGVTPSAVWAPPAPGEPTESEPAPRFRPSPAAAAPKAKLDVAAAGKRCSETKVEETRALCDFAPTNVPINIEWVNTCGAESVDIAYLDKRCHEVHYATLAAGETKHSFVWAAYAFRIRDHDSKHLLKEVLVDRSVAMGPDYGEEYETRFGPPLPDVVVTETSRAVPSSRGSAAGYKAKLHIVNRRSSDVEVVWVNYEGKEVPRNPAYFISSGQTVELPTIDKYLWRVRDSKTRELLAESSYYPGRNVEDEIVENTVFVAIP